MKYTNDEIIQALANFLKVEKDDYIVTHALSFSSLPQWAKILEYQKELPLKSQIHSTKINSNSTTTQIHDLTKIKFTNSNNDEIKANAINLNPINLNPINLNDNNTRMNINSNDLKPSALKSFYDEISLANENLLTKTNVNNVNNNSNNNDSNFIIKGNNLSSSLTPSYINLNEHINNNEINNNKINLNEINNDEINDVSNNDNSTYIRKTSRNNLNEINNNVNDLNETSLILNEDNNEINRNEHINNISNNTNEINSVDKNEINNNEHISNNEIKIKINNQLKNETIGNKIRSMQRINSKIHLNELNQLKHINLNTSNESTNDNKLIHSNDVHSNDLSSNYIDINLLNKDDHQIKHRFGIDLRCPICHQHVNLNELHENSLKTGICPNCINSNKYYFETFRSHH